MLFRRRVYSGPISSELPVIRLGTSSRSIRVTVLFDFIASFRCSSPAARMLLFRISIRCSVALPPNSITSPITLAPLSERCAPCSPKLVTLLFDLRLLLMLATKSLHSKLQPTFRISNVEVFSIRSENVWAAFRVISLFQRTNTCSPHGLLAD